MEASSPSHKATEHKLIRLDGNGNGIASGNSDDSLVSISDLLDLSDILKRQDDSGSDYNDGNGDGNGQGIASGNSDDSLVSIENLLNLTDILKRQDDSGSDYNDDNGGKLSYFPIDFAQADSCQTTMASGHSLAVSLVPRWFHEFLLKTPSDSAINLIELADLIEKRQADNGTDYNDSNGGKQNVKLTFIYSILIL